MSTTPTTISQIISPQPRLTTRLTDNTRKPQVVRPRPKPTPFWFGGAASCVAALVTHPLDLTKVRMQTTEGASPSGMFRTIGTIVRVEGFFAIYNGLSASILRQITYSTVRFGVYDKLKEGLSRDGRELGFWGMLVCAMTAGAVGGAIGNPADVTNVRMQNDGKLPPEQRRNYKHALDGLVRITREEGVGALGRGIGPNVNRAILMTVGQLVSYDVFKGMLLKTQWFKDDIRTHFTSSLLAGLVATTICSPVDVVKTRVMNSRDRLQGGSLKVMADVIKMEGPLALFKGWTPAFIRLGPHTIVTFMVLEQLKKTYAKFSKQSDSELGKRRHGIVEDRNIGVTMKGN